VELGLRTLHERSAETSGRAYQITVYPTPSLQAVTFERSPSCPLHEEESIPATVRECADARSDRWTPSDLLERADAPDGAVLLDWPLTAGARCRSCDELWEPLVRRARFRGQTCRRCGSADVAETAVLTAIEAGSAWACRSLSELGLPAGHVFEIVRRDGGASERVYLEMTGDLQGAAVEVRP